ncbi:hypothetical protein K461DRAFT_226747 [Myriangium duriaei CBS 260.36]|uniref:Hemerythrin-like domain-containing protein n=1 Tax=Myriangium duriaei CBS 260.36 TaxID=1168546 RepID=A0A9P4MM88_9PEZI|nr:hypothetical protein K461DRAFT_226747 [Myriangium duriaei CBS 260.36]
MASSETQIPPPAVGEPTAAAKPDEKSTLPPLSDHDFRVYNHLAEHMDMFHNHFRAQWNMLYDSCVKKKRAGGQSIRSFIGTGLQFCQQLEFHHGIEESYVFPMLAKKMPEFRKQEQLIAQHRDIHKGLDKLQDYLGKCSSGETELRLAELKVIMDSFGKVLWDHLDEEVETLGAQNMRRYWTKDEVQRLRL